ncbi:DUF1990 family protein [Actinomadura darangshiensis]|uniref:DUF1990 family protein n=1 Tax=Actinomadura darangshiensis TaxID=705336 RepID=UPI0014086C04|nr:DUF1990 family protein [Actinomadura darangshiensis]
MPAAQLIERLGDDLNAASPVEVAVFDKTSGTSRRLEVGDEYVVHMPGPWNCPVRVVERTPVSFRFATLHGHMEAGEIEFRARDVPDGLVFTIESWARSADRLAYVLYERLGIAKEMQLHMWAHFCTRAAEMSGGRIVGDVEVSTERADVTEPGRWQRLLAGTVTASFARTFALAARLRERPLHPRGLVVEATLILHGTSRYWGVPFLDDRAELPGQVRLSRALGLPSALPDVLGLALRWRQPRTGGTQATAELLLATTGHARLGRHLLRPARRWSPAFYGSLLAHRAGDRRVLVGAAARRAQRVPGGLGPLARALDERPLLLDLLVATEFGPWERFGELRLHGPARTDDSEPTRFNPALNPVPELPPAGLLQQVRGPTYTAVQRRRRGTSQGGGPMKRSTRVLRRMRQYHADLRRLPLNFDPSRYDMSRPQRGWHVDDYRQPLPAEPPGPPVAGGSWEAARSLVRNYAYADRRIIREVCHSGPPEPGRNMLLEGRFYGLRFLLGLRVGDVVDGVVERDGHQARVWGWNYGTLEGHLERGQMDQEVRKWLDTGEVEFHVHAFSQRAPIPNPIVRLGFILFGRFTQVRFYRRACRRMEKLTKAALAAQRRAPGNEPARPRAG